MKYDILVNFREHLKGIYTPLTAKKYYFAVQSLFDGISFDRLEEIPMDEIQRRMMKLKTKNNFSATKQGLLQLKSFFPDANIPDNEFFEDMSKHKRNYKTWKPQPLQLDTVKRKINVIRDKKLKLAYRLMLVSGARVSEVAALIGGDVSIDGESIQLDIINGKGGKDRTITTIFDSYLAKELPQLLASSGKDEKVFYSAGHMQNKAAEYGFQCHDLRRAFSKAYLKQQKLAAPTNKAAKKQVMAAMGHTNWRTTKIYLKRKIKL